MSKDEQQEYASRMKNDPEFAEKVALTLQSIDAVGRAEIRARVAGNYDAVAAENLRRAQVRRRIFLSAASVLLLAISGIFYFRYSQTDLNDLYDKFYTFQQAGSRDLNAENEEAWSQALHSYSRQTKGDFQQAVAQLETLLQQAAFVTRHGNEAYLYLGISYLELDAPHKAISAFNQVSQTAPGYAGDATWYRALAWLKLEDKNSAIQAFSDIKDDPRWSTMRRNKAARICEQLGCP